MQLWAVLGRAFECGQPPSFHCGVIGLPMLPFNNNHKGRCVFFLVGFVMSNHSYVLYIEIVVADPLQKGFSNSHK